MRDPLSIVLDAAKNYADQIEGRQHDDATIARGERIRNAVQALKQPAGIDVTLARAQRDWLLRLHELIDDGLQPKAETAGQKLDGVINLLDAILDSLEGYSQPLKPASKTSAFVYIVPRNTCDGLSLSAFEQQSRAEEYADRYPGALVYPEILMNDSAAAQFLIDTSGEDRPGEPDDPARPGSQDGAADGSEQR